LEPELAEPPLKGSLSIEKKIARALEDMCEKASPIVCRSETTKIICHKSTTKKVSE
jgi:hypothetical protein